MQWLYVCVGGENLAFQCIYILILFKSIKMDFRVIVPGLYIPIWCTLQVLMECCSIILYYKHNNYKYEIK